MSSSGITIRKTCRPGSATNTKLADKPKLVYTLAIHMPSSWPFILDTYHLQVMRKGEDCITFKRSFKPPFPLPPMGGRVRILDFDINEPADDEPVEEDWFKHEGDKRKRRGKEEGGMAKKAKATDASNAVLPPRNEQLAGHEVVQGTIDSDQSVDPDEPVEEDWFKPKPDKRRRGKRTRKRGAGKKAKAMDASVVLLGPQSEQQARPEVEVIQGCRLDSDATVCAPFLSQNL